MENKNKIPSNKSFGIVFFVFFFAVGLYPLINSEELRFWSLILSFVFLILGLINSSILTPLNLLWSKFGMLLGKYISPIIMAIIFFCVVTPTGLIMKILRKDLLNLKKKDKKSYWIERKSKSEMKNQF